MLQDIQLQFRDEGERDIYNNLRFRPRDRAA